MTGYLIQAFIYLCAAVIAVPLAKRFGLGSVLGYLIAGVVIGPLTGLVGNETQTLQHFAEFGVVMMLFLVGLELEPRMLWSMRHRLLGLGGLQVGITILVILLFAMLLGTDWRTGLVIGMILALSSTAIVLQTLNEKGLSKTEGGRSAFSVLLFQDIAVIPMLAIIPLLEVPGLMESASSAAHATGDGHGGEDSFVAHLPNWLYTLVVIGAIGAVILAGHFLSRPLFNYVANSRLREIFTASSLMLVIGIAALMSFVGLSPALGTFLAGVVLANSEFRHELESNIEPFKGLLLGLFFITVGAGINFSVLSENLTFVLGMTVGIIILKAAILYGLAILFKLRDDNNRWLLTLSLAQAGEFGFVLLSFTVQNHVLPNELAQLLALVVALSMFLTPVLFILLEKVLFPKFAKQQVEQEADEIDEKGQVIIAGIGRFGQIVNRLLIANDIETTVLDHDSGAIDRMRRLGRKGFFGDPTRPELLETAMAEDAAMLVIAIDDNEKAVEMVEHVKRTYPDLPVLVRAYDQMHMYELKLAGADHVIRETFLAALDAGGTVMQTLGYHAFHTEKLKQTFMQKELRNSDDLYEKWVENKDDDKKLAALIGYFRELEDNIHQAMRSDSTDRHSRTERGWTPPPKDYIKGIVGEDSD